MPGSDRTTTGAESDRLTEDILTGRLRSAEAIRARLVAGETLSSQIQGGYTPLIAAARELGADAVAALLDAGSDLNACLSDGKDALHMAAMGQTRPRVLEMLIAAGMNPNKQDASGRTALHYAAMYAKDTHGWVVASLLGYGADPLIKDAEGKTPRDVAETREARAVLDAIVSSKRRR